LQNPLLVEFSTPFETLPFDQINTADFLPALEAEIEKTKAEIDQITQNPAQPSFDNTIEVMEKSGKKLGIISGALFNLNSAETSKALQEVTQKAAPILTALQNDIRLNEALFQRIQKMHDLKDTAALTPEQKTLLEKEYKGFVRNGALLPEEKKEKLRAIDQELAQLGLRFGENVLEDSNAFSLQITDKKELSGLPQSALAMAKQMAEQKSLEGWLFTLDYPSYVPFMTYADNRGLRKKMSLAFGKRGFQQNDHNNETVIQSIVQLRYQRANLLGYDSHAAFVLEERMAKDESTVREFLNDLRNKAYPKAKKEWEEINAFGQQELGYKTIEKWDTAYISEKIKQVRFAFNEEKISRFTIQMFKLMK
jgi:Zn-dependent oligopeptidase